MSALVFGGVPRAVLELAETGECELFYSDPIQNELRRVLADKFRWSATVLDRVWPILWSVGQKVTPDVVVGVHDDPDDNRILECGLAAEADFSVFGDRHRLALRSYKSIRIVSPRQFLEAYLRQR